ncbi:MAG TPA: GNAT family N-acetyltransferase [Ignavibacteriales bacterium]|nr:GNAT family N-acetyltransferase [Ignavibacteriales bacterium]
MIEYAYFSNSGISPEEWDDFVKKSDNGTIFHEQKFLSYHPVNRFSNNSVVFFKNNKILALLPATIIERDNKRIFVSHQGASYGGFVYKDLNLQEAHKLVELLIKIGKENDCNQITLTLPPIIYQKKYSNYIDFALYRNGFSYLKRELSSVVRLDFKNNKPTELFRDEAIRAVNKAKKLGVEIIETEEFEEYYSILKNNLRMRHNVTPTHSLDELLKLKKMYPTKIRLFGAFKDEKLIAGVCNFSANSEVVLAFYISHNDEYQEYRPVNLLFHEIMQKYQLENFKYLDFGIFTVNMDPNWGLGRFKENFGARGIFRDTFTKILF